MSDNKDTQATLPSYTPAASWTDDCMGKQDYDGAVISISTRYWPRGGGYFAVNNGPEGVSFEDDASRPRIRPSAHSSLVLNFGDKEAQDYLTIAAAEFEGDTEDDVKRAVESWALGMMERVVKAMRGEFGEEWEKEKKR